LIERCNIAHAPLKTNLLHRKKNVDLSRPRTTRNSRQMRRIGQQESQSKKITPAAKAIKLLA